jgi:isopenicillin-N N-acyltransferase-like protein
LTHSTLRHLILPDATPLEQGRAHGETWRDLCHELAAIRTELTLIRPNWQFDGAHEALRGVAARHVPLLEAFDPDGAAELRGIADGAALPIEDVVLLNHYTDLRDIHAEARPQTSDGLDLVSSDDGCTVVTAPGDGRLLAQTWDTHWSAHRFVCLLGVPARDDAPAAWLYSITGCVGMAGMNAAGVGIAINNLLSNDARIGVVWPSLIRRMLRETTARDAFEILRNAPIGSGHHYVVADADDAFALETSGTRAAVMLEDPQVSYHHTNHCLDPHIAEVSRESPTSTTRIRFGVMGDSLAASAPRDLADVWQRLYAVTDPPKPGQDHGVATCGACATSVATGELWAVAGQPPDQAPTRCGFANGSPTVLGVGPTV